MLPLPAAPFESDTLPAAFSQAPQADIPESSEEFESEEVGYWTLLLPEEFAIFLEKHNLLNEDVDDMITEFEDGENDFDQREMIAAQVLQGVEVLKKIQRILSGGLYISQENLPIGVALNTIKISESNREEFYTILGKFGFNSLLDTYIWGELDLDEKEFSSLAAYDLLIKHIYPDLLGKAEKIMGDDFSSSDESDQSRETVVHKHYHYRHYSGVSGIKVLMGAAIMAVLVWRYGVLNKNQVYEDTDRSLTKAGELIESVRQQIQGTSAEVHIQQNETEYGNAGDVPPDDDLPWAEEESQ